MTFTSPSLNRPAAAPDLARRFGAILAGLMALIARRFLRMPHLAGLTVLLWTRLSRATRRFERARARPTRIRVAKVRQARIARPGGLALPRQRGWLVRELGWEAAGFACQLEALLADPAMAAVLAGTPAAGRVLRPLCRMLGVTMPVAVPMTVPVAVPAIEVAATEERPPPVWPRAVGISVAEGPADCPGFAASG